MHIKKLKYFKKNYPEDNCIAGITTVACNEILVGTPCIIYSGPFINQFAKARGKPYKSRFGPWGNTEPGSEQKKTRTEQADGKMLFKQIYEIAEERGIAGANEVILNSLGEVTVLFLFSIWDNTRDHYSCCMRGSQIYFNGSTPLIFDKHKRMELKRLRDVHSNSEIKNFSDLIMEDLKSYRYVNYTFEAISESSRTLMQEDLNTVYDAIKRAFPINTCFFRYFASKMRMDTVSISFYRLPDIMPVFDYKRAVGVGMEIFLTDSGINIDSTVDHVSSATYRFLFAKDRENVFTIDGESIKRSSDRPSNKCLVEVQNIINDGAPKHKKLKAF